MLFFVIFYTLTFFVYPPATNEEVKEEEKEQALSFTSSFSSSCPEREKHAGRTLLLLDAGEDKRKC